LAALAVLVVEDDAILRRAVCRNLHRYGCRVTSAGDGAEGLEALRQARIDVIVSDVQMSPHGGLWLYREATALRPDLVGQFVFCSSEPLPKIATGQLHAERFLLKPYAMSTLREHVAELGQRVVRKP